MPSRHCGGQPFRANSASSPSADGRSATPRWTSAGKRGWFGTAPDGGSRKDSIRTTLRLRRSPIMGEFG